jgi:hypothetical protein
MKYFKLIILSLLLISCGREAEEPVIENFTFTRPTVIPFSTNKDVSPMIRAATIIVVPEREDIKDLVFRPLEGPTSNEWSDVFNSLSYSEFLPKEFDLVTPLEQKILGVSEVVMAAGALRDANLRSLSVFEKTISQKEEEVRTYEDSAGLSNVTCFYKSRPRRGSPYVCRFDKDIDSGFKKSKTFYSCEKWNLFTLDANQEVHVQFGKHQEISTRCLELQADVDSVNEQIQTYKRTRTSAENVVLDLLLETEKVTDLVFAAKASTSEKPDSIGPESSLVFSNEGMTVQEFKLYIDFLPGNASKSGYYEYSIDNGAIKNTRVYLSKLGVKKLSFSLELPDMTFDVDADISVDSMPIGFRVIDSSSKVTFKNGKTRKGVFKLEFDIL